MTVHVEFSEVSSPESIPRTTPLPSLESDKSPGNTSLHEEETCPDGTCSQEKSITVGPDNADYLTIQDAVANATPGDSIIVRPGRYQEQVTISVPLSLTGESIDKKPVISAESGNIITIASDGVILKNITLSGSGETGQKGTAGVFLSGASDIIISDCRIFGSDYGIHLNKSENNTIEDCVISHASQAGILLTDMNHGTIENNSIDRCQVGLHGESILNMSVKGNLLRDNEQNGAVFDEISNSEFSGNLVSANAPSGFTPWDGKGGVSFSQACNITLSGNQLTGNGGTALLLDEATRMHMSNNNLTGNYAGFTYGGKVSDPHNRIDQSNTVDGLPIIYYEGLTGQTIEDMAPATLYLQSCSDMMIQNVTLSSRNGYGIMVKGGHNVTINQCRAGENLYQNILLALVGQVLVTDSEVFNGSRNGIGIVNSHNVTLSKNRIKGQRVGIAIKGSSVDAEITNNSLIGNGVGFMIDGVRPSLGFGTFEGNTILGGRTGLLFHSGDGGTIIRNEITGAYTGMNLTGSSGYRIEDNLINATQYGVLLAQGTVSLPQPDRPCSGNILTRNTVNAGNRPVIINGTRQWVYGNTFCLNDFSIEKIAGETFNDSPVPDSSLIWGGISQPGTDTVKSQPAEPESTENLWNTGDQGRYQYGNNSFSGNLGNHWTPYSGKEIGMTGIGDMSYQIDDENSDRYPLTASHTDFQIGIGGYVLDLREGWNFISTPSVLAEGSGTASIFSGINSTGHSIYTYTNASWRVVAADDRILPLHGYWIYSVTRSGIPLVFDPGTIPSPVHLDSGWNAIGFPAIQPENADNALSSLDLAWLYVVPYNATVQQYEESIGRNESDRLMYPSSGYWIFMNQKWDLQPITG